VVVREVADANLAKYLGEVEEGEGIADCVFVSEREEAYEGR
jgi:hypothetical protein